MAESHSPSPTALPTVEEEKPVSNRDGGDKNDDRETDLSNCKDAQKITALPAIITDEEGASIPEASNGSSMYQYRDFSNVPEEELEQQPISAPPPPSSRGPVESSIRVQKFPVKLYAILAQKEFADIICWMPHGRSWKVLKPNLFESLVMPLFFEYSNYHSFNRLVNAWSFRRISSGPDRGSYYHELFLRGKPYLQKYMRRLPKTHKKLPMKKDDEPDFYSMDKANPLPAVDEAHLPSGMSSSDQPMMRGGGMSPMRGGQDANGAMLGSQGMAYKDSLMSRHHPMGMGMNSMGMMGGISSMQSMGGMGMGMGNMNPMMAGSMGGISSMGGMGMDGMSSMMAGGLSGINSMGAMGMGNGRSPMAGSFRDSQFGTSGAASAAGDVEFQRLRHIQQMHMYDRQMGSGSMNNMGGDPLDRMRNMEMRMGR